MAPPLVLEKGNPMSKKLMLLAAGALTALAFAALPTVASAGEFSADCLVGATCTGTIAGGTATLQDDSGGAAGRVTCSSVSGTTSQTSGSSTGTAELTFHGCKEGVSNGTCTSAGQAAGTITTNSLVSHLVRLEFSIPSPSDPGVLLTGINVTFTCSTILGPVTKTVTGNIIGSFTFPNCGIGKTSQVITFAKVIEESTTSPQKWTQITTIGTKFD